MVTRRHGHQCMAQVLEYRQTLQTKEPPEGRQQLDNAEGKTQVTTIRSTRKMPHQYKCRVLIDFSVHKETTSSKVQLLLFKSIGNIELCWKLSPLLPRTRVEVLKRNKLFFFCCFTTTSFSRNQNKKKKKSPAIQAQPLTFLLQDG